MTAKRKGAAKKQDALTVRFQPGVVGRLQAIKERIGMPIAEQIRRAIAAWLEQYEHR